MTASRTYVNLMAQWHPAGQAREHPELDRRLTAAEYRRAVELAHELGIERLERR